MAETAKNKPAEAEVTDEAGSTAATPNEELAFSVEQLIEEARPRLDVAPYVMAGALHGYRKKTITVAEADKLVTAFLKREV